jgi:hypothetical protein
MLQPGEREGAVGAMYEIDAPECECPFSSREICEIWGPFRVSWPLKN